MNAMQHQLRAVEARFVAINAYNRATRTVFQDRQKAQLLSRLGDMMLAIAKNESEKAAQIDRDMAMIEEWENVNSWENMPCGNEW